mgnify:CR=1 FL=1
MLTSILFILRTGIPWGVLPLEMGCGCGMTCKRRLLEWMAASVFDQLLQRIVEKSDKKLLLKKKHCCWTHRWLRQKRGEKTGKNPTDRGKCGSKYHVLTEGAGVPLVIGLSGTNVPDCFGLQPLVHKVLHTR